MNNASADAKAQAKRISDVLIKGGAGDIHDKKLIALIAYLQRLSSDIRPKSGEPS